MTPTGRFASLTLGVGTTGVFLAATPQTIVLCRRVFARDAACSMARGTVKAACGRSRRHWDDRCLGPRGALVRARLDREPAFRLVSCFDRIVGNRGRHG